MRDDLGRVVLGIRNGAGGPLGTVDNDWWATVDSPDPGGAVDGYYLGRRVRHSTVGILTVKSLDARVGWLSNIIKRRA